MDVTLYPNPNPALSACLLSTRMRQIMGERAGMAQLLYVAQVAKRSGDLARSARAVTSIGGKHHDRWIGELIVGGPPSVVDYAAAHEFGVRAEVEGPARPGAEDEPVITGGHHAAHDLNIVLQQLGSF